jgi:hypothetical protein
MGSCCNKSSRNQAHKTNDETSGSTAQHVISTDQVVFTNVGGNINGTTFKVRARFDFEGLQPDDLLFKKGDLMEVVEDRFVCFILMYCCTITG